MNRWDLSWLKQNRPLLWTQIVGTPILVAWFLFFYFQTHSAFALVLIALIPVFAVLNVGRTNRARERQVDQSARRDVRTGSVLAPPAGYPFVPYVQPTRWIGAADVPGTLGRMSASTPLAILELVGQELTLRIRPAFLSSLFGMKSLKIQPSEVDAVFPAKGRLRYPAICIRPHNEPPFYFLLGDRAYILSALSVAGFPVEWEERAYSPS